VLDHWSSSACQADKNVIYEALFAVVEGSVFLAYEILDEDGGPPQFFVMVKEGLGTKIRLDRTDSFGILYIGSPEDSAVEPP
jgi:hypothetical protein